MGKGLPAGTDALEHDIGIHRATAEDTGPASSGGALRRLGDAAARFTRRGREPSPTARAPRWRGLRVDLRVLLLSADGQEPAFQAWQAALELEGVPHDAIVASRRGRPAIDARTLAAGPQHARYQAIIVATGGLPTFDGARHVSALHADEWAALADFERQFGVRRITGFAYPSAQYGLGAPLSSRSAEDLTAELTDLGRELFGELQGPIPIDPSAYVHLAKPTDRRFQTLVAGPRGSALMGIHTQPSDGREELVCTVDGNAGMIHTQLLRHGALRWVTRGTYVGHHRHYLAVQVDDVFLGDASWDPDSATTLSAEIRMEPEDVAAAETWSRERGMRLDLVFNGHGAESGDPLTEALIERRGSFGWINHTYRHFDLDGLDEQQIDDEVRHNTDFGRSTGLAFDESELITGEHSGLDNPALPAVLDATGVRWIAADNSRDAVQRRLGPALTVPRHPTNMYYNVSTREAQLDQYHNLYLARSGRDAAGPTRVRLAPATTWQDFLEAEARTMLEHILSNDPRPHYVHQSNLTGDRMLYDLVDAVIDRHRELFTVGLEQPTLAETGQELARQARWREALQLRLASAYAENGQIFVSVKEPMRVPLTGVTGVGGDATGQQSGWTQTIEPEDGHATFTFS